MSELLDSLRRAAQDAGSAAPALEILLRVTVLLLAAMLVAVALRRSSAALRHLVWVLSLVGALLIPPFSWAFPAWQWAILPQRQEVPSPSATPIVKGISSEASLPSADLSDAQIGESFEVPAMPPPTAGRHLPEVASEVATKTAPTAAPPNAIAAHHVWSWPVFLAILWAVGTFLGVIWLGIGIATAWHIARRARPAADSQWQPILRQLLDQCGCRRPVAVRECSQVSVPMTWGLRRPVILVPAGSAVWSEETKRSVLLHEQGHIRRGDCLTHWLGRLDGAE